MSNESGDERVFNRSVIIDDDMRSNIIPNTCQNIVNHRFNVNIVHILEKHVVFKFLRHKKDGWSRKKDGSFCAII